MFQIENLSIIKAIKLHQVPYGGHLTTIIVAGYLLPLSDAEIWESKEVIREIAKNTSGFTFVELMIALFLLTIGILGMFSMQLHAIKGNSTAMIITNESNWASDRIEKIIATDYDLLADGNTTSPDGKYQISWTVDSNTTTPNTKSVNVKVFNTMTANTVSYSIIKTKLY